MILNSPFCPWKKVAYYNRLNTPYPGHKYFHVLNHKIKSFSEYTNLRDEMYVQESIKENKIRSSTRNYTEKAGRHC